MRGIAFSAFKICYKSIVIKTVWCCNKFRVLDQQYKIESTEINPQNLKSQPIKKKLSA